MSEVLKLNTAADIVFWYGTFNKLLPILLDANKAALMADAALREYKDRTLHLTPTAFHTATMNALSSGTMQ